MSDNDLLRDNEYLEKSVMALHTKAIVPGQGQESVWDYPRPPRLEAVTERIVVRFGGETIVDTTAAFRVLETSHPPVYYLPPHDTRMDLIIPASGSSFCEFKGSATYVTIVTGGRRAERAGWRYDRLTKAYSAIAGCLAFYASKLDETWVGPERVTAQQAIFMAAGSPRVSSVRSRVPPAHLTGDDE